ncbi:MAG: CBS domain-containing protein [Gemmatimonadaceae bacterium]
MLIGPLAASPVLTVGQNETLAEAARIIWGHHTGSAVIVAQGQPPGIITERDLLRAVAEGADVSAIKVSDYMTPNAVTITASWDVVDAARLMIEKGFRHLVVVNDSGKLMGIVSIRDMVKALVEERQRTLAG